ncbi:MAG TPA: DNA-formamidopyrimidine glycosylase family protein [Bryobacteraceae bacterium]|nr:DNA-formamidopyrimidine glycosylase family protein [Bryobacteraceae bacterium]
MPEMPEVEAVCRRLREQALGAQITGVKILRPRMVKGDIAAACTSQSLNAIDRTGKYILLRFPTGGIQIHLRMTGSLYVIPDSRFLVATVRAVWDLADGRGIVLEDPRAHARLEAVPSGYEPDVGIDPLSPTFTPRRLAALAKQSRRPAKIFLLDQSQIAGLGNIYSAEILFAAGLHPSRAMNSLTGPEIARLHAATQRVLTDAIATAETYYLRPGHFQDQEKQRLTVYGREGEACRVCKHPIVRIVQATRSTYLCLHCQE